MTLSPDDDDKHDPLTFDTSYESNNVEDQHFYQINDRHIFTPILHFGANTIQLVAGVEE